MWRRPRSWEGTSQASIPVGSVQAGDQGLARLLSWEGRQGRQLWHPLESLIPRHQLAKWPQLGRDSPPPPLGSWSTAGAWPPDFWRALDTTRI